MPVDPRTPVLIGHGQVNHRDEIDPDKRSVEPVDLMVAAAQKATEATGAKVLEAVDSVRVVNILSAQYRDPGLLVGQRIGATEFSTLYSPMGGNVPQSLVNQACLDIQNGRAGVVLLTGAETWRTRRGLRAKGSRLEWTVQDDSVPMAQVAGDDVPMAGDAEIRIGLDRPAYVYPLFEQALRIANDEPIEDHAKRVGELWARFNAVAVDNPHAWIREPATAEEITHPGPRNRMISWPYTKLMNSNNMVDQGAALLLTSVEQAKRLQIPAECWVYPQAGTDAHDTSAIAERDELHRSTAIRIAGARVLELAGLRLDDLDYVDLYSCFPSAVQVAAAELGAGRRRPRAPANRHRRPDLRGRPVEQLRYAFHRHPGRVAGGQPRAARPDHRQRRLPDQTQLRCVRHRAAGRVSLGRHATSGGSRAHPRRLGRVGRRRYRRSMDDPVQPGRTTGAGLPGRSYPRWVAGAGADRRPCGGRSNRA